MLCPYCLGDTVKNGACTGCKESLPTLYTKGYSKVHPPVVLSAVGFSGHGKTVYLAGLLHALQHRLPLAWPHFFRQGLDMNSIDTVKQNLGMLEHGDLPESTRRNFPRPSLHLLDRMPKYKSRQLIIYDPPGEAFEEDLRMEKYAGFVKLARTVVFLVSLVDLSDPLADELHRLLEVYVLGMTRMKANTRRQHLVIVYTKADVLQTEFYASYPFIIEYLQHSDQAELGNIKRYMDGLQNISKELERFTTEKLGAHAFANMAHKQFKSISYCTISALGSPPQGGRLSENMQPRRVVDPLLWVLERA